MAVERRKKRQAVDSRKFAVVSSMFVERNYRLEGATPSFDFSFSQYEKPNTIKPTKTLVKIGTKTQKFGSLISGKVYQTALNEPVSSLSMTNYATFATATDISDDSFDIEEESGKEKDTFDNKPLKNKNGSLSSKTTKTRSNLGKTDRLISMKNGNLEANFKETVDMSEKKKTEAKDSMYYAKRKLLNFGRPNRPLARVSHEYNTRIRNVKKRSADENHDPLILSPTVPYIQANLHPTGLVNFLTGVDVINGQTTEWTTRVEGTFIDGTYAHVVRSTSKIFLTITKTALPSMTDMPQEKGSFSSTSNAVSMDVEISTQPAAIEILATTTPSMDPEVSDNSQEISTNPLTETTSEVSSDNQETSPMPPMTTVNNELTSADEVTPSADGIIPEAISETNVTDINFVKGSGIVGTIGSVSAVNSTLSVFGTGVTEISVELSSAEMQAKLENTTEALANAEDGISTVTDTSRSEENMTSTEKDVFQNRNEHPNDKSETGNQRNLTENSQGSPESMSAMTNGSALVSSELSEITITDGEILQIWSKSNLFDLAKDVTSHNISAIEIESTLSSSEVSIDSQEPPLNIIPTIIEHNDDSIPTFTLVPSHDKFQTNPEEFIILGSLTLRSSMQSLETGPSEMMDATTVLSSEISTKTLENNENIEIGERDDQKTAPSEELKRVKREEVTILNPDGRILSGDANILLTPTTHYTTHTYYTTILLAGGGTSIVSDTHVDSSIANPISRVGYTYPYTETRQVDYHPCCDDVYFNNPIVRDGDGYVAIPVDDGSPRPVTHSTTYTYYTTRLRDGTSVVDTRKVTEARVTPIPMYRPHDHDGIVHYHTATQPLGGVRHVTHRTRYTVHRTSVIAGTPVVITSVETETNVIHPNYGYDHHDLTRRMQVPVRFGTDDYHTHAVPYTLDRPSRVTHRTTYTYHTTRFRDGTPIVNTREQTETNITPIPTYYRPTIDTTRRVSVRVRPSRYPSHTHVIDPALYKPDSVTHRTTYTYHTTRFRDGTPIVNTREETETNATPIPTYGPRYPVRPTVVTVTNYDTGRPYHGHDHHHDEPYLTHRTTYTYYTSRLRGATAVVDTRRETQTNLLPNPNYRPFTHTVTRYLPPDDFHVHDAGNQCPTCRYTNTVNVRQTVHPRQDDGHRVLPSTATHYSTYTYVTTTLRNQQPELRTREHTVTEVYSGVVLPTLSNHQGRSSSRELTFGERIRSKRTLTVDQLEPSLTSNSKKTHSTFEMVSAFSETPLPEKATNLRKIKKFKPEIDAKDFTFYKERAIDSEKYSQLNYAKRRLLSLEEEVSGTYIKPTPPLEPSSHFLNSKAELQNDLQAEGDERRPIIVTPATYYTTHTIYSTILKPGGKTVIETDKIVLSSVYNREQPMEVEKIHSPKRKIRRKKVFRNQFGQRTVVPCDNCNGANKSDRTRPNQRIRIRTRKVRPGSQQTIVVPRKTEAVYSPPAPLVTRVPQKHHNERNSQTFQDHFIKPSRVTYYSTYTYFTTELQNGRPVVKTREHTVTEILTDVILPTVAQVTNRNYVQNTRNPHHRGKRDEDSNNYNEHKLKPSVEFQRKSYDLLPLGADARPYVMTPTTHYTTHTYYTTVLKPGGSKVIESNTKVSSSVYYPQNFRSYHENAYDNGFRNSGSNIQHPNRIAHLSPSRQSYDSHIENTREPELRRYCPSCSSGEAVSTRNYHRKPAYVGNVQSQRRVVQGRHIPQREENDYHGGEVKPTHVTFYSTYTYFTTELQDNHPVVKSREHTVTEVLTNVIVPTVVRGKRSIENEILVTTTSEDKLYTYQLQKSLAPAKRKLLQLEEFHNGLERREDEEFSEDYYEDDNTNDEEYFSDDKTSKKVNLVTSVDNNLQEESPNQSIVSTPTLQLSSKQLSEDQLSNSLALNDEFSDGVDVPTSIFGFKPQSGTIFFSVALKHTPRKMPDIPKVEESYPKTYTTRTQTSDMTKNGKITRYTTTIYGTYINGLHAQRAESESEVIPLPDMTSTETLDASPMYSPNRSPGLVSIKVSKVTRGPVAIHFTTEIYGTYVAGAYAQTARTYTSYQRLSSSSSKEAPRQRVQTTSTTHYAGPRRTGLLSSRILKTKIEDGKTLLFVSEIHGTHIGGAYAHMGSYVTRTMPTSGMTSSVLPTYKLNEIEIGLITTSEFDRIVNGTTTRYHYEVHGTFLDGTYAHVPSARTAYIYSSQPQPTIGELSENNLEVSESEELRISSTNGPRMMDTTVIPDMSYDSSDTSKTIGLVKASSRVHINNGTITKQIFEIYGTYLDGMYAHVPSVSIQIIKPTDISNEQTSASDNKTQVLKAVDLSLNLKDESSNFHKALSSNSELKTGVLSSLTSTEIKNDTTTLRITEIHGTFIDGTYAHVPSITVETITSSLSTKSFQLESSIAALENFRPHAITLLPKELRHSFPISSAERRLKREILEVRNIHLESSFINSITDKDEKLGITLETPFLNSVAIEESSLDELSPSKCTKCEDQTKHSKLGKAPSRHKRTPFSTIPRRNKRFENTREVRKFGTSTSSRNFVKSSARKASSTPIRSYRPSTKSSSETKMYTRSVSLPKRSLLFPPRNSKNFISGTRSVSSTLVSSSSLVVPKASRSNHGKFGKMNSDLNSEVEMNDEFEASEDVIRSVTESSNKQRSPTRPPKFGKFLRNRKTLSRESSRYRQQYPTTSSPRKKSNLNGVSGLRNRKSKIQDTEESITPTSVVEEANPKRRFTLTTSSFSIKLKPTSSFMLSTDEQNFDDNTAPTSDNSKRRGKFRSGNRNGRRGKAIQSSLNTDENEVATNRPKTLPLPPFGRSRGFKRPSTFDPRTLKDSSTSSTTSTIIYVTNNPSSSRIADVDDLLEFGDEDLRVTPPLTTPVTITSVLTTTKTLAVHLGVRTSFATITTTTHSTSVIPYESLTTVTKDGFTKTVVSTKLGYPDSNLPIQEQSTRVTEYFLTTTEIDTTSYVAIKLGYGTRTDTIIARQILTTLASEVNMIRDLPTASPLPQFPYFDNPFLPPIPTKSPEFPISIAENSYVATETLTSTTVLPLLRNGKTLLTTLTSTSVTESLVVQTTTLTVPPPAPSHPFVFPQPVFIFPSVTTQLTLAFTAHNGEVVSLVTLVTVPLMPLHGNSRFVRSANEIIPTRSLDLSTPNIDATSSKSIENPTSVLLPSNNRLADKSKKQSIDQIKINVELNLEENAVFRKRKLLQFIDAEDSDETNTDNANIENTDYKIAASDEINDESPVENENIQPDRTILEETVIVSPLLLGGPDESIDENYARPIPPVRVVPTRRAYIRRIRPGGAPPQPFEADPYQNAQPQNFGLRQNSPNSFPQRFSNGQQYPGSNPFVSTYHDDLTSYQEPPVRNTVRSPAPVDNSVPPQGRRVIRLRRPGNVPVSQPELFERQPIVNAPNDDYVPLRARGPAVVPNPANVQDLRNTEPNYRRNSIVPKRAAVPVPLTYYTTFTYMTTFLNGPSTAYSTREAVVSNIATETLNPTIIELIRSRGGFTSDEGSPTAVPLGSRENGPTTTVVNLASRVQVYNSNVYYNRPGISAIDVPREEPSASSVADNENSVINTLPISEVAALPKTYYTLFTYYYTLRDGDKSIHSQRSEVISNVATDREPFIKQSFSNTIDDSGYLTLSPEKETINLGSREAGGTTTEVNLELKTLVHFDNLRNVVLERDDIAPALVEVKPTVTQELPNNYLEHGDAEVQDQNTYPQTVPIQPSFSSGVQQPAQASRNDEATPEIPKDLQVVRTRSRIPVRVTTTKLQRPGSLRSRVLLPKPGVRVRLRPLASPRPGDRITEPVENFEPSRNVPTEYPEDEEDYITTPRDDVDDLDEEFEDDESSEDQELSASSERKRVRVTIRRPPGGSVDGRPSRSRQRFYVVTRTASPGSLRSNAIRPVSVKITRRPKTSAGQPRFETYTTVTSVPVVFGLTTTFRRATVTSSSLLPSEEAEFEAEPVEPSKTIVLTYFTTTTYTVPFTVSGRTSYTTFEETNSRVVTETLDSDADLSFISTTKLNDFGSYTSVRSGGKISRTLSPDQAQTLGNQLNVGGRQNLYTKVSNGVTLIMASEGDFEAVERAQQPTGTLSATTLTDALHMMDKDYTTIYEPRTFYTTFTFFTTFFSAGTPTTSTSEQIVTNIYTIPITKPIKNDITRTEDHQLAPVTLLDTMEQLVSTTLYTTHTFFATLFNGTETIVTPIEELQSAVISSTETYTITKTVIPTLQPEVRSPAPELEMTTTTTVYRTLTNYVTLFRGQESVISPLEEIIPEVLTLTLDHQPSTEERIYTTRTIQATNTHYVTLFSGGQQILSSITEVAPSVITEVVRQLHGDTIYTMSPDGGLTVQRSSPVITATPTSTESVPTFQDLVPSVRTHYTTLTYFTTLYRDSSTILSSREEVATSYITLFVPAPAGGKTTLSERRSEPHEENIVRTVSSQQPITLTPTTEILTFYTTYTYYTTLFRGTETIISDSETVVTQYVTIESTPTEAPSKISTTAFVASDVADVRLEPSSTLDFNKLKPSVNAPKPGVSYLDDDMQIIGVSTKVQSDAPSILTGTPTTDAHGSTHILFTDFIVPDLSRPSDDDSYLKATPALPDNAILSNVRPSSNVFKSSRTSTTSDTSQTRETASDLATTRLTDALVATHLPHLPLRPTTPIQSGGTQTNGIKPGAVIDLSDVLSNTYLVGNLGETIKGIVNLFAAGNRQNNLTSSGDKIPVGGAARPTGGIPVKHAEEPLYIPIGAVGKGSETQGVPRPDGVPANTLLSGFTPVLRSDQRIIFKTDEYLKAQEDAVHPLRTSIVFGTDTIFIEPTRVTSRLSSGPPASMFGPDGMIFIITEDDRMLQSSKVPRKETFATASPTQSFVTTDSTSIITGVETIFFGIPDGRLPPLQAPTRVTDGSRGTSSIIGVETFFFDTPMSKPAKENSKISGETTIFGSFPIPVGTETASSTRSTSFTKTSSGATTIFFPLPGDRPDRVTNQKPTTSPGTRYVTSVESVTLTLTLTTSSVYQSEDVPVTVTSVLTTTIPPRTFVSTIIGSRTILGTQPEPTEAVQVIPTIQPSESTTTVTTTTLIFNSIATTVVRTLVIPTQALQPTGTLSDTLSTTEVSHPAGGSPSDSSSTTKQPTTARKPIQLFRSPNRSTSPATPKAGPSGPAIKLFPTRPPTTSTNPPPPTTTKKTSFRKPGKALVPATDGCQRECNLKKKEVCKQNSDRSWTCQCRPGFFRKKEDEECRDVKSYTVLVRVFQMGGNDVSYHKELSNSLSPEYQNLTTTARKAVDNAYKTSSVGDNFVSTNVLGVAAADRRQDGVLVNLTVTLTGDKTTSQDILKDELVHSLEASASEAIETNATIVSPIIQRVEDVQDFDECADDNYNDCSRSSECINLPGTYTCECREGYQDLEPLLPGRICSGEIKDCDFCNNRGVCIMTEDDQKFCRCYRMYLGKQCEINGLVLAIALPIALALLILTMFCLLCGCRKLRRRRTQKHKQNVFKAMGVPPLAGTLDRKAMIIDSSSESSADHHHHHAKANQGYDGFGDDPGNSTYKREATRRSRSNSIEDMSDDYGVPTVVIPRARHHHSKQVNPGVNPYHRTLAPYDDHW